jgi:hypothetical protein
VEAIIAALVGDVRDAGQRTPPRHRALADAIDERAHWLAVREAAEQLVLSYSRLPS